jgi:hypothetical protein
MLDPLLRGYYTMLCNSVSSFLKQASRPQHAIVAVTATPHVAMAIGGADMGIFW